MDAPRGWLGVKNGRKFEITRNILLPRQSEQQKTHDKRHGKAALYAALDDFRLRKPFATNSCNPALLSRL
jgi:hypothetical protein